METPHSLDAVERTCLLTSACRCEAVRQAAADSPLRALDTAVDEHILARLHGGDPGGLIPQEDFNQGAAFVAARGLELDALLLSVPCSQVVLLGVGMDPRPWRLRWPAKDTCVFEVDTPAVLALRRRAVQDLPEPPACRRVAVEADLADWDDTLRALLIHGLRPYQPVVWLAEGLLGYLPEAAMAALFRGTRIASPPGSAFVASCPPSPAFRRPWMTNATFEDAPQTTQRAEAAGWAVRDVLPNDTLAAKYNIPFVTALVVLTN